jgi:hypothetical protein
VQLEQLEHLVQLAQLERKVQRELPGVQEIFNPYVWIVLAKKPPFTGALAMPMESKELMPIF